MQKVDKQKEQLEAEQGISRRDLLVGLGAAAATVAYSGNALAAMPGHNHANHSAQQPGGIVHQVGKIGVQVPQQRRRHSLLNARMNVAGSGSQQGPVGRIQVHDGHNRLLYAYMILWISPEG